MKQLSTKRAACAAIAYFLIIQVAAWMAYFTAGTHPPLLIFAGATMALGALSAAAVFYISRAPNAARFKWLLALLALSFVCEFGAFLFELFAGKLELQYMAKTIFLGALIIVLWASKGKAIWKNVEPEPQTTN